MKRFWAITASIAAAAILICLAYATGGFQHTPRFSNGTRESPISLDSAEVAQVTGDANYYQGMFYAHLYNGTAWTITSVDVTLTKKPFEARRFRLSPKDTKFDATALKYVEITPGPAKPYAKAEFQAPIGDFLEGVPKEDWSWGVTEVLAFRE